MWPIVARAAVQGLKALFACGSKAEAPTSTNRVTGFEWHMQYLSQQTGCRLLNLVPTRASFEPCLKELGFITVLVDQGPTISTTMFSNIQFRAGHVPLQVQSKLGGLTPPGHWFHLDILDGRDGSFVIAEWIGPANSFTPEVFAHSVAEMMQLLALVDAWIMEQGYA